MSNLPKKPVFRAFYSPEPKIGLERHFSDPCDAPKSDCSYKIKTDTSLFAKKFIQKSSNHLISNWLQLKNPKLVSCVSRNATSRATNFP